ncbi:MAG: hypothetical protein NVSMB56_04280 [Pyrinomonadaceae bacterium]
MRKFWMPGVMFVLICVGVSFKSHAEINGIKGDYVEVRTASVFAGACQYNGELTTTGRDALMAWNVASGQWHGVDLAGVRALAIVSADANLADAGAAHRSELVIDTGATEQQAAAMSEALRMNYKSSLGSVVAVRRAPVNFQHEARTYTVGASDLALMKVEAMPNDECCKMPHLVWYAPLVSLTNRKVGYTKKAIYAGGKVGDTWQRTGENGAFYGDFQTN